MIPRCRQESIISSCCFCSGTWSPYRYRDYVNSENQSADYRFKIIHRRLQSTDDRLQTSDHRLQSTNLALQNRDYRLHIAETDCVCRCCHCCCWCCCSRCCCYCSYRYCRLSLSSYSLVSTDSLCYWDYLLN